MAPSRTLLLFTHIHIHTISLCISIQSFSLSSINPFIYSCTRLQNLCILFQKLLKQFPTTVCNCICRVFLSYLDFHLMSGSQKLIFGSFGVAISEGALHENVCVGHGFSLGDSFLLVAVANIWIAITDIFFLSCYKFYL